MAYSSITKPGDHFNTKLYSGNSSTNAITGVGFQPDLVWLKRRTVSVAHHLWHDIVRGKSGAKYYYLESSSTIAQNVQGDADGLSTLDSDGFTLTYNDSGAWNVSGSNYVSWNFKADGTPSSNTDGTITSSVSANTTAGFSIVSWTNASDGNDTVGHGLNSAPEIVITKKTSTTNNWTAYTTIIDGSYDYLFLNTTAAKSDISKAAPTSSVFTTDMGDTSTAIAYAFHSVKGYSKFGSYTGNYNTDGTFIYTGFKPAWVMTKRTDSTSDWRMFDGTRAPLNPANKWMNANSTAVEGTDVQADLLSNGFKLRDAANAFNASGGTFIYMAFAENPLVASVSGGLPATAV